MIKFYLKTDGEKVTFHSLRPFEGAQEVIISEDDNLRLSGNIDRWVFNKGEFEVISQSEYDKGELKVLRENERNKNKEKRKSDLSSLVATVNGKNIQVRESDELYLRRAIEAMEPSETRKWIMADNSVDIVTREELVEALNIGLSLGQSAFDEYIEWLENN